MSKELTSNRQGWANIAFYLIFALFACHEMDAIAAHEWRLLPLINMLEDKVAQVVFILGHIPIFSGLLLLAEHQNRTIKTRSRAAFAVVCGIHSLAHYALSGHELYEFQAPVETVTVHGAGAMGFIYLLLTKSLQQQE
ncbi:MAG: hypothetical protein P1V97_12265 [Planctomycetota bacterium]|nr:hypothetical protein [Planctomycetota bacterium]